MVNCGHPPIPGTEACAVCPTPSLWREQALCRQADPEAWWPEISNNALPKESVQALGVCRTCPVRPYCVEDGWNERWGIWGGYTAAQRDRLREQYPKAGRPQMRALGANPQYPKKPVKPRHQRNPMMPEDYVTRCDQCGAWMIGTCTTQHDKEGRINGTALRSSNREPDTRPGAFIHVERRGAAASYAGLQQPDPGPHNERMEGRRTYLPGRDRVARNGGERRRISPEG